MILNDWINRKLAAQLHPWLRDEPQLEVKLGLFRSNGTLDNITFDTSKLNDLLDDPSVYCFKEVTVEHLSLQFSPFSSTAFTLVIRGIRAVLSLGEEQDEGGVKWRRKCRDTTVEDRNKVLQDIDPEGCALHGSIKNFSEMTTRTWGKSLLNTVLRHCRLQLLDIHVRLQTPRSHDPLSCSLYMKKFEIGSQIMDQRCFTRSFMSSFLVPSEETSFDVDVGSFEIRLNSDKLSSCVFPSTNMFVLVSMSHLHFTRFCFRVPTLNFLLSTADLSVLLILYGLLSKETKCTRTGRQLWNIVASKLLLTPPKMTLIKVVRILCLSLRYIKTYQSLLLLVGFPTEKTMRRSTSLMLWDARYSSSVKYQWKNINQIENGLPLESIILARRIIRSTMASTGPGENKVPDKLVAYGIFSKLHQLIVLILSAVINFLFSVMRILSMRKALGIILGVGWSSGEVCDFLLQQSISLNVQEISLSVSPDVELQSSVRKKGPSNSAVSHRNFLSLHLSIDGFFLHYTENMSEKRLTSASGCLKILSSIVKGGGTSYAKKNQDKELNGKRVISWGDSAQVNYFPGDAHSHATTETCSVPHLATHLGKLWLTCKDSCLKSTGECTPSVHSPWILCDIRSFLTDHGLNSRFLDCSLVVGKLNFNVDYSAVPPITVLLRQMQYAIWCAQKKMKSIPSRTPKFTVHDVLVGDWRSTFRSISRKIEMDIIRMLPDKHIQIGVLIEGPHIQVSLLNDDFDTELTGNQLISQVALKICNIELWVSPNLDNNPGLSHGHASESKSGSGYLGVEEPLESSILKSDSIDYSCQGEISLNAYLRLNGLKVYLGRTTENQKYQVVELSPMTLQLKYLRKDYHSFGSSIVAFSAVSHCVATGFSSLVYLDELYIFTKIILCAFHGSFIPDNNGSNGGLVYEEQSSNEAVYLESESGEMLFNKSSLESRDTHFIFSTTCEIKSFDVVLHNSRKIVDLEEHIKAISIHKETGRNLVMHDSFGNGIYLSVQPLNAEFVSKGGIIDVIIDAAGVKLLVFESSTESEGSSIKSDLRNLLSSLNFVTEASVSHIKLWLHLSTIVNTSALPSACLHNAADDASSFYGKQMLGESSSVSAERLEHQCLCMSLELSGIYMAGCKFKDVLVNENNFEKLSLSFSAGADFRSLSCNSKGGSVLLEASAAVIFAKCFLSYYNWIVGLWPASQSSSKVEVAESYIETAVLISQRRVSQQEAQIRELLWDHTEIVSMSLSSLSLVLVATDESGRIQELLVEIDFHFNFKLLDAMREFSASSKLSLLSRFLYGAMEHRAMVEKNPLNTSSRVSPKVSRVGSSSRTQVQKNLHRSPLNYILRDMKCSLAVEGPIKSEQTTPVLSDSSWVGNGSLSGLDITISLSEIKMILSSVESVSELSVRDGIPKSQSSNWSINEEPEEITEGMVTDGMIVAIQDIDQHMYIAVGGAESRYDIAGTLHYSLVGERSLFRVKFHNSRWKSKVQYFSLISLHARDGSGEPLRLSGNPQSRYVDISCPNDGASALWRIFPFKPDPYEDVAELESFHFLTKRAFHLVNKKNDCAIAFIDGVLEFVSQPGNLFKWKVFSDPGPSGNNVLPTTYSMGRTSIPSNRSRELLTSSGTETNQPSDPNATNLGELMTNADLPGITITVQKVILTVVHELSDTEEKFPLLQGSLISNQVIMQISGSKVRFMNTFEVSMSYFDAHRNLWTDFMQPVEICTFVRFKFLNQHPEKALGGAPSNFYAKLKEVNILVSELALDIVLFVIGEIDLAGPYAVKSSAVLANCCKVENLSGLSLLCQFYDNQEASVSPRQSTTIYLRHLALANRPPEASLFSVQLFQQGNISTSPIHLSLLDARQFAWRTRIISHDSKSFSGPLIAIEISRTIEDGLSIVISPLLRIHNETDFSLDLRFQRLNLKEKEYAPLVLKAGSVIDDTVAAFSAINLSGGLRKVLTSLSLGNYVFSFRPTIPDGSKNLKISSVEWSDDLKGKKPVRLSGLFDKLSYQVRKALSVDPVKASLSSANCTLISEDGSVINIHFLIQTTGKGIPVINPDNFGYAPGNRNTPVAMQEQKEVFVLPTVQVSNFLHTEVHVNLTDSDPRNTTDHSNPWGNATIPYGSAVNFYVNPESIYFVVTLTLFGSSCKPVNSSDWVRKLQKKTNDIRHLDIELEFGGGKYFAMLRLSRGHRGTLQAVIFTSYALQNNTTISLVCFAANKKPSPRSNTERPSSDISPDVGSCLPPNSTTSWFLKCHKLNFTLLEEKAFETELDLDALSGFTEIDLRAEGAFGSNDITRLGVSLRPWMMNEVSSQIVALSSRYVISNESEGAILVRQCYIEDTEEMLALNSKQRISLKLKTITTNKKETNFVDRLLRKHTKSEEDLSLCVQFRPNEAGFGWSGPVCVASLGRFFLKFRQSSEIPERQSHQALDQNKTYKFAAVHVVEEGSIIVLHFFSPPHVNLPYRIENLLRDGPITYYQKGSAEPETLGAGDSINYVWDDLTLPHKLVIQLDDVHLLREINLDKVRSWKPFYRNKQTRNLGLHLPLAKGPEDQKRTTYSRFSNLETVKVGYEIYAEGVTRVLRICAFSDRRKVTLVTGSSKKMRLRISYFAVHLLEYANQDLDLRDTSSYAPIIITRLEKLNWDCLFTDEHKYNQIRVQSLSMDEKWEGAPFAAVLRRHQTEKSEANDYILRVGIVLLPMSSGVKPVKYLSIVLQPLDLNLDEETLMKVVPFWRKSLSQSSSRQQYYFDHFEIHPIKIVASFLPGDSLYSYSSTQETLRSLLHSVIKIPTIKNKTVELNGVLVTHALITLRELTLKCAQHYSWYAMRAIYIAKGSPLLPPAFASVFDDLASSSLDVFFDPSSGLVNVPGVTLGTLKLISKFIDNKGFSGTKRYFGDLGKTLKTAGSNVLFAAITEVSDSVLKGAETTGFNGMVLGFHQGILKLAMEPSVLSSAFMEGGPDRKIKLDRSPGVDELYIEGYLQAMLDTTYKQEYLRVRVVENQVILKNLPPSSSLIDEIMERVKDFLASKALLKGRSSMAHSLRHIRGEREWKIGPTLLTLCEHLFVSFTIQALRKQAGKALAGIKWKDERKADEETAIVSTTGGDRQKMKFIWRWGIGKFLFSGLVAYVDGRLCRNIPHPLARRIVSGFLLSFLDKSDGDKQ